MKRTLLIITFWGILILPAMSQTMSMKDQKTQKLRERSMAIMREQQMRTRNMKTHKMPDMAIAPQEQALEEELRNAVKSNDGLKAEGLRNQLDALRKQHK